MNLSTATHSTPQPLAPIHAPPSPLPHVVGAIGVIGVVGCVSFLEGMWTWLLAAAISEVAGQSHPSVPAVGLVLFVAWLSARITALAHIPLERRRWLLIGGGIALAAAAGTVQAGVLLPAQLLFGHYTPDYRGAGILLLLLVAYLWGRGLALAMRVNRERVIGHIGVSASALAGVLVFLPLTDAVQYLGLAVVIVSFLFAIAALLLAQLESVESRQLTPLQWLSVAAGGAIALVLGGLMLTGAFSSGALGLLSQPLAFGARLASPVVGAVLLAAGYLAQYLAFFFRWLSEVFGVDTEAITRTMQQAQGERLNVDTDAQPGAPEVLTMFVAISLTLLFILITVALFYRLVSRIWGNKDDDIEELRMPTEDGGPGAAVRGLFERLFGSSSGDADGTSDPRAAIRRHYRAFQVLMMRADHPRDVSQTPREYQTALAVAVPPADPHVTEITDAYELARYAPPEQPLPDPDGVRRAIGRVRDSLRAMD